MPYTDDIQHIYFLKVGFRLANNRYGFFYTLLFYDDNIRFTLRVIIKISHGTLVLV